MAIPLTWTLAGYAAAVFLLTVAAAVAAFTSKAAFERILRYARVFFRRRER